MATYKVIQDIEAEDKILGPLTLRQFIFAMIAVFLFYMCFIMVVKHVVFMLVIFLPPALFFGFFALPFGRDQPTEIWFLAKLRFWFKPRQRVWNQSGVKELVTITVPKKVEHIYTNGLSENEVQSRLQVLAQTIDTRGWATKHASSGVYDQPIVVGSSDRLIDIGSMPQEVPNDDVAASANDIMDANTSPIARQFDNMIDQSSRNRRQKLVDELNTAEVDPAAAPAPPADNWFTGTPHPAPAAPLVVAPPAAAPVDSPVDPADEAALAASLTALADTQKAFGNLRTMQPLSDQPPAPAAVPEDTTVTAPSDPAILSLAASNDLNLSTLAREAKKNRAKENQSPDEVVVPLH